MHPPRHSPHRVTAVAALLEFIACACRAAEPDIADSKNDVQTVIHCESCPERHVGWNVPAVEPAIGNPAPASASPAPNPAAVPGNQPRPAPNPFADLRFRDQEPLVNRLRRLQALPFVTLWDSGEATVYVGVDRRGKTGLHLRQKVDDRGTRAARTLAAPEREPPAPRPPKSRRR